MFRLPISIIFFTTDLEFILYQNQSHLRPTCFPLLWLLNFVIFHSIRKLPQYNKMSQTCAILPEEVDLFIQSLRKYQLNEIGCKNWFDQHEVILKLGQQAVIEGTSESLKLIETINFILFA